MIEYIAQMTPMLLLAGLAAGWVSETVSPARGYGLMYDLAPGIAGSLVAGMIVSFVMPTVGGMTAMFVYGCLGAGVAIVGQRQFRASLRPRA